MADSGKTGCDCGHVVAVAWRPRDGDAMQAAQHRRIRVGAGLDGERGRTRTRGVTLLSAGAWSDVCRDLGVALPWHARRANLLIDGVDLAAAVGRDITIGDVTLHIHGESKPCSLMDARHPGLRAALTPASRGGVYGEVLTGGTVAVGDDVTVSRSRRGPQPTTNGTT